MRIICLTFCVLTFCCSCSQPGKELSRKEFKFIILGGDAKKVWYNATRSMAFIAVQEDALQNKRYRDDLRDEDLYDEPQYFLKVDSKEEYEAMMDSLVSKLPTKYLIKKDTEFIFSFN